MERSTGAEIPANKPFVYYTEHEPFHPNLVQMYGKVFHFLNEASVSPYEQNIVAIIVLSPQLVTCTLMKSW